MTNSSTKWYSHKNIVAISLSVILSWIYIYIYTYDKLIFYVNKERIRGLRYIAHKLNMIYLYNDMNNLIIGINKVPPLIQLLSTIEITIFF